MRKDIESGEQRVRVLLVDGDELLAETAKECLRLQGNFAVETARSSYDALKKIDTMKPDVIVCSSQLRGQNCLEFLKILRDNGCATPFIVFTVDYEEELAVKAFHLGANGFISKNGNPEMVYPKLKNCIESVTRI